MMLIDRFPNDGFDGVHYVAHSQVRARSFVCVMRPRMFVNYRHLGE